MPTTLALPRLGPGGATKDKYTRRALAEQTALAVGLAIIRQTPGTAEAALVAKAAAAKAVQRLGAASRDAVLAALEAAAASIVKERLLRMRQAAAGPGAGTLGVVAPGAAFAESLVRSGLARPARLLPAPGGAPTGPSGARAGRAPCAPTPAFRGKAARPPRCAREPRRPRPPRRPRTPRTPRPPRPPRPPRRRRPERDPSQQNKHYCQAPQSVFKATGELGCNWTTPASFELHKALGDEIRESPGCADCQGRGCRGPLAPLGNWITNKIFGPPAEGPRPLTRTERKARSIERRRGRTIAADVRARAEGAPPPPTAPGPAPFCGTVNCIVPGIGGTQCFDTAIERDAWMAEEAARCRAETPGYLAARGR